MFEEVARNSESNAAIKLVQRHARIVNGQINSGTDGTDLNSAKTFRMPNFHPVNLLMQ